MSEFVKKTAIGYRPVHGGQSDPECTHVILTKKEYDQILQEKAQSEKKMRNIQLESERALKQVKDDVLRQAKTAQNEARQCVEVLEREVESKTAEIALQIGLNANLLRISKERANADRKLSPKKEHTGYVVVSSSEKEYRYKDSNRYWRTATLWETILQSPYSVDFTEKQARKLMLEELFQKDENGSWPIGKIGITGNYSTGYAKMISDKDWQEEYKQYNVMLDRHLRANFRFGYWEIVFMHTKPLGIIPKDMRARGI